MHDGYRIVGTGNIGHFRSYYQRLFEKVTTTRTDQTTRQALENHRWPGISVADKTCRGIVICIKKNR